MVYHNLGCYNSPLLEFKLIPELVKGMHIIFLEILSPKFLSFPSGSPQPLGVLSILLSLTDDPITVTDSPLYH